MILNHSDPQTGGTIQFIFDHEAVNSQSFKKQDQNLMTILWNKGAEQEMLVDDEMITVKQEEEAIFSSNQTFSVQHPKELVVWRFNRDFYCIIDHDEEVSCVGLLFYGHRSVPKVCLDGDERKRFDLLVSVFKDEYSEPEDNLKTEMLRVILKRLIVKLTRLYKKQSKKI